MTWFAPHAAGSLKATVTIPGSKSLTNRMLPLAALAQEATQIAGALTSRDSDLMIGALRQLGVHIEAGAEPDSLIVNPAQPSESGRFVAGGAIDCGLAGTVMRFVPPLAALATGDTQFDGDPHARLRPMAGLIHGMRSLGIDVDQDRLPLRVRGRGQVAGGEVTIDSSDSSQFVSALLMAAPAFTDGILIHHEGAHLPSLPHIDMTIANLVELGVDASVVGPASWQVKPGPIRGGQVQVEPDLSNAGPFLAAALAAGGQISIPHWPTTTTQPGDLWRQILPQFGATVAVTDGTLTVRSDGTINPIDLDLSAAGELTPVVVALASLADGPSQVRGVGHLRGHETDRLAALVAQINALGGKARELADGIAIDAPVSDTGQVIAQAYADHRMAHFAAVVGLRRPQTALDDIACTSKTMPRFEQMWAQMLAGDEG